jgi:spore germination cell wall hydrolase CwlJ-like protein
MTWADWFKALLALVLWREARGEGHDGMRAVAHVIKNRVDATDLPDQWDDVIGAKRQFSSMTAPGDSQLVLWPKQPDVRFEDAMQLAEDVYNNADQDNTGGAHYYANLALVPPTSSFWKIVEDTEHHPQTAVIGHHTFFK